MRWLLGSIGSTVAEVGSAPHLLCELSTGVFSLEPLLTLGLFVAAAESSGLVALGHGVEELIIVDLAELGCDGGEDVGLELLLLLHVLTLQAELLLLGHVLAAKSTELVHDV